MLNNEGETAYQNCEMSLKQYFREKIIDTHMYKYIHLKRRKFE